VYDKLTIHNILQYDVQIFTSMQAKADNKELGLPRNIKIKISIRIKLKFRQRTGERKIYKAVRKL